MRSVDQTEKIIPLGPAVKKEQEPQQFLKETERKGVFVDKSGKLQTNINAPLFDFNFSLPSNP